MIRTTLAGVAASGVLALSASTAAAQELPLSGVSGFDFFYSTSTSGSSSFTATNVFRSSSPFLFGPPVDAVPSRWAHRRRTLGATETVVLSPERGLFVTPMGDAPGNGALHVVDVRGTATVTDLVATQNPAGYDLVASPELEYVFSTEDDGNGGTTLRGWSYSTIGVLSPLTPPSLTLPGPPAAYVSRIGHDGNAQELHVPTAGSIHVVELSASAPHMEIATALPLPGGFFPCTNPAEVETSTGKQWMVGTSSFSGSNAPLTAGWFSWNSAGVTQSDVFGSVPSSPGKDWVPAAGTSELAVVSDGSDAYAYYLLREPPPGTFFIKPSAIGAVRFVNGSTPVTSTILMPDSVGEPFALPAVSGTRVAFESSFGPPFTNQPAGGGEKISILYTPLDPLGAGTTEGVLGVPAPLGGRISTKGMDRPIWSRDGSRVMASTSHFPGAPNPAIPGLEVLDVPIDVPLDRFVAPHTVVANLDSPNQSIVYPSAFRPRVPSVAAPLGTLDFFGSVFHQGMASLALLPFGEVGQQQLEAGGFVQSPAVPNFRSILPPIFDDVNGSLVSIPGNFGPRRTAFNFNPGQGLQGLAMSAAFDDEVVVQTTMTNLLALLGIGIEQDSLRIPLPTGSTVTTEFFSF